MAPMERFDVDADRILLADGETLEFFWRGVNPGSSKWRFHVSQVGAELSLNRKGTHVDVKIGDRYSGRIVGDVQFDVSVERSKELAQFLARNGVPPQ